MSSRARTAASGVLSFTFLDVLMCTMGSLLLLLTVLAKRAELGLLEEGAAAPAASELVDAAVSPPALPRVEPGATPTDAERLAALEANLAAVREAKAKLEQALAEATDAQSQEQARLAHLEEHQRRLQHELAQLHIAMLRLKESEERGFVDRQQAEDEAKRLEGLVRDAEKDLEKARSETETKRSFAIVPYKGKYGTFRRPIYIECVADGAVVQPEGIKFSVADLKSTDGPGNPLAAAVRAAHEELDRRAGTAASELPNAYPLLIVRPSGARTFRMTEYAISSWNADYGYQLVEEDWMIHFDEPDPRLAEVMNHAAMIARERRQLLARMAPRRYAPIDGRLGEAGEGGGGGDGDGDSAFGASGTGGGSGYSGRRPSVGGSGGELEMTTTPVERRYGEIMPMDQTSADGNGTFASQVAPNEPNAVGGTAAAAAGDAGAPGDRNAAGDPNSVSGPANGASMASSGAPAGSAPTGGNPTQNPNAPAAAVGASANQNNASSPSGAASADEKRPANWANAAAAQRRSSPVTRPIRVTIRKTGILVIPSTPDDPTSFAGASISFDQSTSRVLDDFANAVQEQVKDWGSAGMGLYWRPTLIFDVAPGAEPHAKRLARLMANSGLDVKLPVGMTAQRPDEEVRR